MDEEFFSYKPAILGFVLNVSPQNLEKVKAELVEAVGQLESDDRAFVFHPDDLEVQRTRGAIVGSISRYQHPSDFDLSKAIRQAVYVLGCEEDNSEKYLFVIADDWEEDWNYGCRMAMQLDLKERFGSQFIFCGFVPLPDFSESHPRYKNLRVAFTNIKQTIINTFKEQNGSHD